MAHSLVVCDAIPAQTTVVKLGGGHLSSGHVCFWLTSLKPGHTRSYDLVLRVDTGAHGRIVNRHRYAAPTSPPSAPTRSHD